MRGIVHLIIALHREELRKFGPDEERERVFEACRRAAAADERRGPEDLL